MAKVINITDKFNTEKPKIVIGEDEYEVDDGVETVLKFQELSEDMSIPNLIKAFNMALGEDKTEKLNLKSLSIKNFRVLTIAVMAAMQSIDYEEAEARFRTTEEQS